KNGTAPYSTRTLSGRIEFQPQPVVIDEATLRTIAESTGGRYFRATDNRVLSQVFQEIDALEKTQMDVRNFSHTEDNYMIWAWLALLFFGIEVVLRYTVLRSIP
ncbi:MAG: aerotolerance regulator BatA, partial [Muribaculaceae bacterium]|nr:aerotolerance regulator BatA [Muribaculaceae bacterium]